MLYVFKVLPKGGTKKAGPLPAPKGCPQFATKLYLAVIHLHYVSQTLASSNAPAKPLVHNGDEEARTPDLRRAKAALSQLSYIPGHYVQSQGGPGWTRTNDLSLIRGTL